MEHKMIIDLPAKKVYYPKHKVSIFNGLTRIGTGQICSKSHTVNSNLDIPSNLIAAGDWVLRDGDIISELHINRLYLQL